MRTHYSEVTQVMNIHYHRFRGGGISMQRHTIRIFVRMWPKIISEEPNLLRLRYPF